MSISQKRFREERDTFFITLYYDLVLKQASVHQSSISFVILGIFFFWKIKSSKKNTRGLMKKNIQKNYYEEYLT